MICESAYLAADHAVGITIAQRNGSNHRAIGSQKYAAALYRYTAASRNAVKVPLVLVVLVITARIDDVDIVSQLDSQSQGIDHFVYRVGAAH